ncbi:MAG: HAMP domain-containing histidine kinase [Oscillospiraceae bacterium]|nr:HAMP domain-containing histidine kinase [Oscillospiraceae bacterium]
MGGLKPVKKIKGLRRRWIINTVSIVCVLGLICVLGVTAAFASYYYSAMESDMRYRARTTTEFFSEYINLSYNEYYQSCIAYAQGFEDKDVIELQFINAGGRIVASSYGKWAGQSPTTSDISSALKTGQIQVFRGENPQTGERIMAVSSPMVYSNGETIGVLRYVTSLQMVDIQILQLALIALSALLVVLGAVLLSSNYYIRSILVPVSAIVEKAKKISNGTYGIQIEKKYDDEIGDLVDAINEMSVQINQNEKMQTEFISSLSHELRTPLTAITGWSETILSGGGMDEGTRRGVKIIHKETERLTEMVLDLLDFTRIQDGRMTLNMELCDIRAEFEDTVFMYGSRLSQDGIVLDYIENDEDVPEISCDPKRLRQVFLNILDNAAKHGGEGKRIEASIHFDEEYVIVRIRDFGSGIPEDEIPLVKKKFYKGSSKARGSGIGLAVCDEIVLMHGGELILENAEGGGTIVTVRIPASQ